MNILSNPSTLICPKHKNNEIIFIKINQLQDNKNILYCQSCMIHDRTFLLTNFVQIQQIIESSNNGKIINWPPVDDKLLQDQIYNFQTEERRSNSLVLQINQYFDNLQTEVISKIEECQKEMIRNISLFSQCEDGILNKLQLFQMADKFQNILLNNKIEIIEKETQCREYITKVYEHKDNYTQELKQMFENLNQKEQQIEFESAKQVKRKILKMIENINFFKIENIQVNNKVNENIQVNSKINENILVNSKINENIQVNNKINELIQVNNKINEHIQVNSKINENIQVNNKIYENIQVNNKINENNQVNNKIYENIQVNNKINDNSQVNNKINENSQINNKINKIKLMKEDKQIILLEKKIDQNIDLLPNIFLTQSNYGTKVKSLQMRKPFFLSQSVQLISQQECQGSYHSRILDRNKKYVFRFQFKSFKKQGEVFSIGLVRDSTINKNHSCSDKLSCCFLYNGVNKGHYHGHGIDKCVKGDLRDTKDIDCVELRVCIEDGILEVVDYPNNNHKYVLSDQYKHNLSTYQDLRLGIYLQFEMEVILMSAHICQQFQIEY